MTNFRATTGIIVLSLAAALAACSSGSDSGSSEPQTGQVAVVITDNPTLRYERILITLRRILLLGGNGGQQVLYDDGPITFDLLQLRDRADLAFASDVLADQYSKIRLYVDEVELIDLDPEQGEQSSEVLRGSDLPANGKIDLNPRGPFTVTPGTTTVIQLDMDANRSFQVVETGNGRLKLRPIIFVDVYQSDLLLRSRLVRVFGTVEEVDTAEDSFLVCDLRFVAQISGPPLRNGNACVRAFADTASIFDVDGAATDFQAIVDGAAGPDPLQLTAIGFASPAAAGAPDNVLFDLDAIVNELGPRKIDMDPGWETLRGSANSAPAMCGADMCFEFVPNGTMAPGLDTRMQPETKVYTADGTEMTQGDIMMSDAVTVDALASDGVDEDLFAALIVLNPNFGDETVSGELIGVALDVTTSEGVFDVLTLDTGADPAFEVCVNSDTDILQILVEDDALTIADLLDPAVLDTTAMLQIEASGELSPAAECEIEAAVVIVEEPTGP